MMETHLSSMGTSVLPLEYHEASGDRFALPLESSPAAIEQPSPVVIGVPEEEVERRIQIARDAAVAEADQRVRVECELANKRVQKKIGDSLTELLEERTAYFRQVEGQVVQLALSIARKILQREAQMDPTLLTALVRIALDRMQCSSAVRVRIAPENLELWRAHGDCNGGSPRWEAVADEALNSDDCIVETELGAADFGFEAQLRDVEESFAQLLAQRPDARTRHAERA